MVAPQDPPHLTVVSETGPAQEQIEPSAAAPEAVGGRSRWLPLLLGLALAACALGWILEARGANRLGAELEATRAALLRAEGQLLAHQAHLARVREQASQVGIQLGTLVEQVTALEDLAETDPAPAAEPAREAPLP